MFVIPAIIVHNIITLIIAIKKKNDKLNAYSVKMLFIFGFLFFIIFVGIANMGKIGG